MEKQRIYGHYDVYVYDIYTAYSAAYPALTGFPHFPTQVF